MNNPVRSALSGVLANMVLCGVLFGEAPTLTPATYLPGDDLISPASGNQTTPMIARGSDSMLVVWTDTRTDLVGDSGGDQSKADIYGVRLDLSGSPLEQVSIPIATHAADQTDPQVVWNGQNWLVVWESVVPTDYYFASQVMATRVSPDGSVLDDPPLAIFGSTDSSGLYFAAASDGTNWVVLQQGFSAGNNGVIGTRIAPDGTILDPEGVVIVPGDYYLLFDLSLAFAQDEYLFVWQDLNDIMGLRFTPDLELIDDAPFQITNTGFYEYDAYVASNGVDFLVAWEKYSSSIYFDQVRATQVNHDGTVVNMAGIALSGNYGATVGRAPKIGWDGTNWFVAWAFGGVRAARVTPTGTVLDFDGVVVDPDASFYAQTPAVAGFDEGGVQLVWTDDRFDGIIPNDIFAAQVASDGLPTAGGCISLATPAQLMPHVAVQPDGAMLVYLSDTSEMRTVKVMPLDTQGRPILGDAIEIAADGWLSDPAIAWDGSRYLVVWTDLLTNGIYGTRLDVQGELLDAVPVFIMPGLESEVAGSHGQFLVVGTDAPYYWEFRHPMGVRLRGDDGAILDDPLYLGGTYTYAPAVSGFGEDWIVVWEQHATHDEVPASVYAAFVRADGAVEDQFYVGSPVSAYNYRPSVATSEGLALIAWQDTRFDYYADLFARRLLPDGTWLDSSGFTLTAEPFTQTAVSVGWNGVEFAAAWEDPRANTFFIDTRTDVYATRITTDGEVMDPTGLAVADSWYAEIQPFTAGIDGRTHFVSANFLTEGAHSAYRVGIRSMDLPSACEGDANGDGTVDPLDSGYVQARFGCAVGSGDTNCDQSDVNGDLVVDPLDVGYILARFGACP